MQKFLREWNEENIFVEHASYERRNHFFLRLKSQKLSGMQTSQLGEHVTSAIMLSINDNKFEQVRFPNCFHFNEATRRVFFCFE